MKKSKFSESQIVNILREAEAGVAVEDLSRQHGFSKTSFYKWKAKYGGMSISEVKRMKELLLVIGVMFLLAVSSCSMGKPEHEVEIFHASGYYSFDPELIFESLGQSDENTFKQIDSVDYPTDKTQDTNSVSWSQEEFLYVMQIFYEFLWKKETGDNWDLVSVEFRTSCEDKKGSFQSGNYLIFQVDSSSGRTIRKTHRIVIKPWEGTIWWSETQLYPVVERWIPVNLENLKISAMEADSIAEVNGGQAIRLDVGNDCVKIISGYHDEWRVAYYLPASNNTVLEFFINNDTGEYRKQKP